MVNLTPRDILRRTDHRPYPLPSSPWLMRQTWSQLLFAHWSLDPKVIQLLLPPGLELDTYDNVAYISVLPFRMSGVRVRLFPRIPGANEMLQLNVRTYVRRDDKPGVYFLAIDCNHRLTVWLTRLLLGIPYHHAQMSFRNRSLDDKRVVELRSQRRDGSVTGPSAGGTLDVAYCPSSEPRQTKVGQLEHWLAERYCMYSAHLGKLLRVDIRHHPWSIQSAEARFQRQSLLKPLNLGFDLSTTPTLIGYAEHIDALLWPPTAVDSI